MGTTARRCAVMVVLVAAVTLGCSSDETVTSTSTSTPVTASSSGSGTTEAPPGTDPDDADKGAGEYAEACAAIEEIDGMADNDDLASALLLFDDARDAGPEELAEHWDTLADTFNELEALGSDDAALTRAFELMADPAFMEAAAAIDDFAEEECGLDIDLDPAEENAGGLEPDGPGSEDTTPGDEDPTSIDSVQAYLQAEYRSESWWPVLDDATSWGSQGSGSEVSWSINLSSSDATTLSASELEAACDAMADYLDTYEDRDVSVEILDSDDAVLVSRGPGEACVAA